MFYVYLVIAATWYSLVREFPNVQNVADIYVKNAGCFTVQWLLPVLGHVCNWYFRKVHEPHLHGFWHPTVCQKEDAATINLTTAFLFPVIVLACCFSSTLSQCKFYYLHVALNWLSKEQMPFSDSWLKYFMMLDWYLKCWKMFIGFVFVTVLAESW